MTTYVPASPQTDFTEYLKTEAERINKLRYDGRYDIAAGRIRVLRNAGWKVSELAENLGVSRTAITSWGTPDQDVTDEAMRLGKVLYLPKSAVAKHVRESDPYTAMLDRMDYTTFDVPASVVDPLRMLMRFAYMSRSSGPRSAPLIGTRTHKGGAMSDYNVAADVLDIVLSVLTRRGVTAYRISTLAEVTHRAVLSRMRRATERHDMPDDKYITESLVLDRECPPVYKSRAWWVKPELDSFVPVGITPGGTRLTIRTVLDPDFSITGRDRIMRRWKDEGFRIAVSELDFARALMTDMHTMVMVPDALVSFTNRTTKADTLPIGKILPQIVFDTAKASEVVARLMHDPESVADMAPEIRKHGQDAKTRKAYREAR